MTAELVAPAGLIALAPCDILDWDSTFWGVPIGRVRGDTLTAEAAGRIDRWAWQHAISCLYFLARIDDAETLRIAEARGYEIVDTRTTLVCALAARSARSADQRPGEGVVVRGHRPQDVATLRAITHDCYHDTRFYRDHHFPRGRCRALYETWIARSCDGYADLVLVAEVAGVVAGFISCHLAPEVSLGTIGLVGVGPHARNQRVGQTLVREALTWFEARGVREVSVVTQGRNVAAQRLYQRADFRFDTEQLWFHKWY